MRIIGLCGRAGAGKSSVASFVKQQLTNVQVVSTGDVIRGILKSKGMEPTHYNLQNITKQILAEKGDDYISFIFDKIGTCFDITVVDSFRRIQDAECFRKSYGPPILVAVEAPTDERFQRLVTRKRASDAVDEESFRDLSSLEDSWGVQELCRQAHFQILNDGDQTNLNRQILDVFSKLNGHLP